MSKYTQTPNRQPLQLHYFKMKVYDRAKYITRGLLAEVQAETQDEEIARYRASHIFRDVQSDHTTLILRYKVAPRDFTHGGQASSKIKRALTRLGADPQIVRRAAIASYEAEMNLIIHDRSRWADHRAGGRRTTDVDLRR
jgi:hypothetical protein